jgi:hypothetical protein
VQLLLALAQQSREEITALLADQESEFRKALDILKHTFEQARKIFSESSPMLFPDDLEITDAEDRETIRLSNLATASTRIFGDGELPLAEIHDQFSGAFIPEDGEISETAANFLLGLKTQAFLEAMGQSEDTRASSESLERYFPAHFGESIGLPSPMATSNETELKLAAAVKERRECLLKSIQGESKDSQLFSYRGVAESNSNLQAGELKDQFPYDSLVDDLSSYLQIHLSTVVEYAEKPKNTAFTFQLAKTPSQTRQLRTMTSPRAMMTRSCCQELQRQV